MIEFNNFFTVIPVLTSPIEMHKPFIQQSHNGEEHIDVSGIEGESDDRDESLEGVATVSPF
jgi:hypothetical protein